MNRDGCQTFGDCLYFLKSVNFFFFEKNIEKFKNTWYTKQ